MSNTSSALQKAKNIPVPEPGTGEFVTLPTVETLCVWMRINHLKVKGWHGNLLVVMPDTETEVSPIAEASEATS